MVNHLQAHAQAKFAELGTKRLSILMGPEPVMMALSLVGHPCGCRKSTLFAVLQQEGGKRVPLTLFIDGINRADGESLSFTGHVEGDSDIKVTGLYVPEDHCGWLQLQQS